MLVVVKFNAGFIEFAFSFDPYFVSSVDQDVGDVIVLQQGLERSQAQHVTGRGFQQAGAVDVGQQEFILLY